MKIVYVHQYFLDHNQPGGTRHFEMAKYLALRGHEVTVITSNINHKTNEEILDLEGKRFKEEINNGIKVIRVRSFKNYKGSKLKRLFNYISFMYNSFITGLRIEKNSIIIASSPPIFTGIVGLILSKIKKSKFVFEVRDLWPDFLVDMGLLKNPIIIWAMKKIEKTLYKSADFIVPLTNAFKSYIQNSGISPSKIGVIPNGIDLNSLTIDKNPKELRKKFNIPEDKFVAIYIGAHNYANNLEVIVEAARLSTNPKILYVLVGDGDRKKRLISKAKEYGLKNILFIEAQPKSRVFSLIDMADVGLITLKSIESFSTVLPNKLFDYLVCNKPIVSNVKGEVEKVINQAGAGKVIKAENPQALNEAVDELRRNQINYEGYNYIKKNFSREVMVDKLEHVLQELVNE